MARREHSLLELRQKLRLRKFDSSEIEPVLQRLVDENLQSEARFCEVFVRSRAERGYGPLRIRNELQQRGVTSELIAEQLALYEFEWFDILQRLLKKRLAHGAELDRKGVAKQQRYLLGRGFCAEEVRKVLKRFETGEQWR
ncbi:MAG: regulatory protein RecX [Gammaproteobacteria bacterium]|nr:regulatory protein RecX [Gammaproteobacteria bacterium]